MTFSDVISDIKKMIGIELHSVRPGAEITIQEVDEERDCLILRSTQGQLRSRPLSELRSIWSEMMKSPAVHVDGVLHGSGTSRNQPETILANLPYVEWLKVNNKKHIAYVGRNTHAYGTLKKMDAIKELTADMLKKDVPEILIGSTVKVHVRIKEGEKERIQIFEGTVIAKNNSGIAETFTVRRVAYGVGVERVFPVHSPSVAKVELVRKGQVRRAKLYYLRDRVGKAAKVKELIG